MIETVLFDLDDTLIEEREWARTGWGVVADALASETGREPGALVALMADAFATDPRSVFDALGDALGLGPERVAECIERYRATVRPLTVPPDAEAALTAVAGRRTGIVTDGLARTQRAKVAGARLEGRVEVIVYTDELGPGAGKPSPAGFEHALAALDGGEPARAVYVADNPAKDFIGPRALGMRSVRVRRAGGVYRALEPAPGAEPDRTIDSLHELGALLAGWDAGSPA